MASTHQRTKAPGKTEKERGWAPIGGAALAVGEPGGPGGPGGPGADDDIVVLLTSGSKLAKAGLDMRRIRVFDMSTHVIGAGSVGSAMTSKLSKLHVGHILLTDLDAVMDLRGERDKFSEVLSALRGLDPLEIAEVAKLMETPAPSADAAVNELYQVLTAQEMADRMKLTLPVIYKREVDGELFAVLEPYRKSGRLFPAFQLDHKLNRPLLLKVIQAYRAADVNTTLLWSFLRTPQRIFDGLTPIEMLVGGMPPAFEGLKPGDRADAILDVVAEELSRVRIQ